MSLEYYYDCIDDVNILEEYENDDSFIEWFCIVKPILTSKEFQKRRLFMHHENESVWTHSIKVSFESFKFAKKHNVDSYNCAIAGILHDFYTKAWQYSSSLEILDDKYKERFLSDEKIKLKDCHGINHPKAALINSKKYFGEYLNEKIENAIVTHMFPLSLFTKNRLPKYKESYVITLMDKKVSLYVLKEVKNIGKYMGLSKIDIN